MDIPGAPSTAAGRRGERRLADRRILVVGGGGRSDGPPGNGQAISVLAAAEGAAVAVADIDPGAAGNTVTAARAASAGGTVAAIEADVRSPDDCERMIREAGAALGGLDGVVLNVGIGKGLGLAGTDVATWDEVMAVNLRAHFLVARAALPALSGGAIVFIGSLAGLRPGTFSPSYDASKAALVGLCRHTAMEGSGQGVRANLVAPGLIDTPMGRGASGARPERDRVRIPLGRQGTAWEVAWATVFLLSDEASYITAQVLVVDGGLGTLPAGR